MSELAAHRSALHKGRAAALLVVVCVTAAALQAQPPPPELKGNVNDFARVLDETSARQIDTIIKRLQDASGDSVVVAVVDTVEPYGDIREYAVKMAENRGRGIGQREKDNGILLVVAIKDRDAWFEVGYDLEQFVTDGFSGETVRQVMAPHFRRGEYGPGILAGVTRVIGRVAEGRNVSLQGIPPTRARRRSTDEGSGGNFLVTLFVLFIIINVIAGRLRRGGRRRRWGGGPWSGWHSGVGPFGGGGLGGFGGGFGGFGGGGGGGGFNPFGGGRTGGGGGGGSW